MDQAHLDDIERLYEDLHAHPELAYQEVRTAGVLADRVTAAGFAVSTGVGGTGVVGVLANGPGPVVLLRADMDGLPVKEETSLPYASQEVATGKGGVATPLMHACGHDVHMACLVGAAEELAWQRDSWGGTLVVLFQPAEEGAGGARAMIEDGLFDLFARPDVILGQHVFPFEAGTVGYRSGPILAASDAYDIRVHGRGGHGSQPQAVVDPIVLAASIVTRIQTIVSREVSPADRVVVTVGQLHAGVAGNIVPDHADLTVSARTFDEAVAERVTGSLRRIVEAECAASGSPRPPEFRELFGFKPTINDPEATDRVVAAHRSVLGAAHVREIEPIMGSEDFPEFGRACGAPSVFWALGGVEPEEYRSARDADRIDQLPTNHSPQFAPCPHPTLATGVAALVAAARAWLSPGGGW
ncbi:amidohydrolase [Nocardioides sp. L-11A]|uniref:amidohydrolase n=1 Tax=Nocardioides sp. L-11A TaxID=3043848 RepID=UPI00249ADB12